MNCERFTVAIHDHYRGTLPAAESAALLAHAAACPACAALRVQCEESACRELVEHIPELVSGTLPPDERARFERHLSLCPDCRAYLASYRQTLALTAQAFQGEGHAPLPEDLVQRILRARERG